MKNPEDHNSMFSTDDPIVLTNQDVEYIKNQLSMYEERVAELKLQISKEENPDFKDVLEEILKRTMIRFEKFKQSLRSLN